MGVDGDESGVDGDETHLVTETVTRWVNLV
jgi:hypothetical protein